MNKKTIISAIEQYRVIAILRSDSRENVKETAEAVMAGGLPVIEISLTTPHACSIIQQLRKDNPRGIIGAGTVNSLDEVKEVLQAGAQFIFSPIFNPAVVAFCKEKNIVSIPGVFSPTEVFAATQTGADFVKLFPADIGGPGYVKTLMAPLPNSRIIAVGGVNSDNVSAYFQQGALAVGVAGSLFSKEDIKAGHFSEITRKTRNFMEQIRSIP